MSLEVGELVKLKSGEAFQQGFDYSPIAVVGALAPTLLLSTQDGSCVFKGISPEMVENAGWATEEVKKIATEACRIWPNQYPPRYANCYCSNVCSAGDYGPEIWHCARCGYRGRIAWDILAEEWVPRLWDPEKGSSKERQEIVFKENKQELWFMFAGFLATKRLEYHSRGKIYGLDEREYADFRAHLEEIDNKIHPPKTEVETSRPLTTAQAAEHYKAQFPENDPAGPLLVVMFLLLTIVGGAFIGAVVILGN